MSSLPDSIRHGADLATVAEALVSAASAPGAKYVERRGNRYRWSLTHRGGPYPLLRETAKLLGVDHHALVLPFVSLADTGLAVIAADPSLGQPDAFALLELDEGVDVRYTADRIRDALTIRSRGRGPAIEGVR